MTDSNSSIGRLGPISIEAEEAVLGSMLVNPEVISSLEDFLQGRDFWEKKHEWIWEAILAVHHRGDNVDYLTVVEELRSRRQLEDAGGATYITYLINNTPSHIYAETYGRIVERAALRRRLMDAAGAIAQMAREENAEVQDIISKAEATLFGVTDQRLRKEVIPMSQAVREFYERVEYQYIHPDERLGVPTGYADLDNLLGGLQKSDLIIVAARPGMGKTSFLLSVALNAARKGSTRVAIFSLEMGREQLMQRFYAIDTGINSQKLRLGKLAEDEFSRVVEATGRLSKLRMFIDDTPGISVQQMRARCRRLYREHGIDLVVVDYLQLMSSGQVTRQDNRVQEVSAISRGLKELARELNIPVLAAAQLSRAVEQRKEKVPQLSDLRESGCLAGDTLVYLPESGQYVPIQNLKQQAGFRVASLNPDTWKLTEKAVANAFCSGTKPIFRLTTQLGRAIRATANHKFLTFSGWKQLDELSPGGYIAVPRRLDGPKAQTISDTRLALLGHLIGDGCTLSTHALQYATREEDLAELVAHLAVEGFAGEVSPRISRERTWYQVYLPLTRHLTRGVRNPLNIWLEALGLWGVRSYEKRIPNQIFAQPCEAIALFLRHLWATDGCVGWKQPGYPNIDYATSSGGLAHDMQSLLLRIGINARLTRVSQNGKGRDQYHIIVTGSEDLQRFVDVVGAVGTRRQSAVAGIGEYLQTHTTTTHQDIMPSALWQSYAVPAMHKTDITTGQMQAALQSETIGHLARSDVYWDRIVSIEADGEAEVFDLTVPETANFVANDIIVHNSLEQDADIVVFLYRDDIYDPNSERPNQADVIVSKHRNGPTGTITLYFRKELTQFVDMVKSNVNLSNY